MTDLGNVPAVRTRPLTFENLSTTNAARCQRWHGPDWTGPEDSWTLADWSNAMNGEAGEAANIVKKIRRVDSGLWEKQRWPGDNGGGLAEMLGEQARAELLAKLADELADVVCYADLLATKAGIDLGEAVRAKFNRVSKAQGFPERL